MEGGGHFRGVFFLFGSILLIIGYFLCFVVVTGVLNFPIISIERLWVFGVWVNWVLVAE